MIPKFSKYLDIANSLLDMPTSHYKHFSFIVEKNHIRAIGWNHAEKTHPIALKFGYIFPYQHSELSAITRFNGRTSDLKRCTLINVRLNKYGKIMQSKPCKNCSRLLKAFAFKNVWYTKIDGSFVEY